MKLPYRFILGSQSPRRREILQALKLPFHTLTPPFDEREVPFNGDPVAYVQTLAQGKSRAIELEDSHDILITADTVVYLEGEVYNKPCDAHDALQMLLKLQGRWHSVYTGIAVRCRGDLYSEATETRLLFRPLSCAQIQAYHQLIDYRDKSGAYAVQGAGGLIVERIEGCFYNAMGLSVSTLQNLLKHLHIDLWEFFSLSQPSFA